MSSILSHSQRKTRCVMSRPPRHGLLFHGNASCLRDPTRPCVAQWLERKSSVWKDIPDERVLRYSSLVFVIVAIPINPFVKREDGKIAPCFCAKQHDMAYLAPCLVTNKRHNAARERSKTRQKREETTSWQEQSYCRLRASVLIPQRFIQVVRIDDRSSKTRPFIVFRPSLPLWHAASSRCSVRLSPARKRRGMSTPPGFKQ